MYVSTGKGVIASLVATCAVVLGFPFSTSAQSLGEIDRELAKRERGERVSERNLYNSSDNDLDLDLDTDTAGSPTGLYIGGVFSFLTVEDTSINSIDGSPPPQATDLSLDANFGNYEFIGWDSGTVRTEVEVGARSYEIEEIRRDGIVTPGENGDVYELSLMFNVIFDIPIAPKVEAYAGGGVGTSFIWSELNNSSLGDSNDFVLSYQFMAGLQFEVAPRLYLNTGYRYHATDDPNFEGVEYDAPEVHGLDLGIRYVF